MILFSLLENFIHAFELKPEGEPKQLKPNRKLYLTKIQRSQNNYCIGNQKFNDTDIWSFIDKMSK